jgi:hypothetical protein
MDKTLSFYLYKKNKKKELNEIYRDQIKLKQMPDNNTKKKYAHTSYTLIKI